LQIHTGLQHSYISPCQDNGLPIEMPTLANKLHDAGYATHMVGKWHIGNCEKRLTPLYRGFDSYFGKYLMSPLNVFTNDVLRWAQETTNDLASSFFMFIPATATSLCN